MGLTLLTNEILILPNDIVLVIDDFDVLEDASIYQGFNFQYLSCCTIQH